MREKLSKWVSCGDALHHLKCFGYSEVPEQLKDINTRRDDYYISLVGELFDQVNNLNDPSIEWSRIGNALKQTALLDSGDPNSAILSPDTAIFAAAAFYFGGYPASAYLTLKIINPDEMCEIQRACFELLARPQRLCTRYVGRLFEALLAGDMHAIQDVQEMAVNKEKEALQDGPEEWVGWKLFSSIIQRFKATNIRSVLPNGEQDFWNPLIKSLLYRTPPTWDFFPSQIEAIQNGLLVNPQSYSIQMPTGAGKTALSETLLFYHLKTNPNAVAILLVPYRSLASELKRTIVRRLNKMGINSRSIYGGTVPTANEMNNLNQLQAVVATPEAISGILSSDLDFFNRVSLLICDEGHLLDAPSRGIGLELLLTRMRGRRSGSPKFVFVSAIVPNIEEINTWLGGNEETVIKSDYRPSIADFAKLSVNGRGSSTVVNLLFHPQDSSSSFTIDGFLSINNFLYQNTRTNNINTYPYNTIKTQAISVARISLTLGGVAVFAANKQGNQGTVGLAEELVNQLSYPLSLPMPSQFVSNTAKLQAAIEYFRLEFGDSWIGTKILKVGAALHHGDIPQESREVIESLVQQKVIPLVICTNTLAEGVNLPICTLVLYSVKRRKPDGYSDDLKARDIKNLVGRAGRAGITTKGLVICANENQWAIVEPIAKQKPGEVLTGALHELIDRLLRALNKNRQLLTNEVLESIPDLFTLVDGIDTTLIDLAAEELGIEEFVAIAKELSSQTFASRQFDEDKTTLMQNVFELRSRKISEIKDSGKLKWILETGTRARILNTVENKLYPLRERWDNIEYPTDPELLNVLLSWAWDLPEVKNTIAPDDRNEWLTLNKLTQLVLKWINGLSYEEIARDLYIDVNNLLRMHNQIVHYVLLINLEQGIALLNRLLESNNQNISQAVIDFPDHLRFGVPTTPSKVLAEKGIRHRRAAVLLGQSPELSGINRDDHIRIITIAKTIINQDHWLQILGKLVLDHTIYDLNSIRL